MTPLDARNPGCSRFFASYWDLGSRWADFALHRVQSPAKDRRHPLQVVIRPGKSRLRLHLGQSNKTGLAKSAYGLRPTKDFINSFAQAQADAVVRVSGGPPIDGVMGLVGNTRRDLAE
jgi:hypothetical protein